MIVICIKLNMRKETITYMSNENHCDINPLYDPDYCYECDDDNDYNMDEDGELQLACTTCLYAPYTNEED